jgi:hypothetical protein
MTPEASGSFKDDQDDSLNQEELADFHDDERPKPDAARIFALRLEIAHQGREDPVRPLDAGDLLLARRDPESRGRLDQWRQAPWATVERRRTIERIEGRGETWRIGRRPKNPADWEEEHRRRAEEWPEYEDFLGADGAIARLPLASG